MLAVYMLDLKSPFLLYVYPKEPPREYLSLKS